MKMKTILKNTIKFYVIMGIRVAYTPLHNIIFLITHNNTLIDI